MGVIAGELPDSPGSSLRAKRDSPNLENEPAGGDALYISDMVNVSALLSQRVAYTSIKAGFMPPTPPPLCLCLYASFSHSNFSHRGRESMHFFEGQLLKCIAAAILHS